MGLGNSVPLFRGICGSMMSMSEYCPGIAGGSFFGCCHE